MRIVNGIVLRTAINADAIERREPYVIYNKVNMTLVETQSSVERAFHAVDVLNTHGNGECYTWAYAPHAQS